MSAEQFQFALVQLVRFPEHFRGQSANEYVKTFELTQNEQKHLRLLTESPYVVNFGKERRWKRFRSYVRQFFPLTVKSIGVEKAQNIFYYQFDPSYPSLRLRDIASTFYSYFVTHEERLRKEFGFPDFIIDLFNYEFVEYSLHWSLKDSLPKVDKTSLLNPNTLFNTLECKYDIAAFVEEAKNLTELEILRLIPNKSSNIILFVKTPTPGEADDYSLSQFNIDAELDLFLKQQLERPSEKLSKLPEAYPELVELGLCKAIQC
jgi:hypothetical protein